MAFTTNHVGERRKIPWFTSDNVLINNKREKASAE
jgi:hypothetical protein